MREINAIYLNYLWAYLDNQGGVDELCWIPEHGFQVGLSLAQTPDGGRPPVVRYPAGGQLALSGSAVRGHTYMTSAVGGGVPKKQIKGTTLCEFCTWVRKKKRKFCSIATKIKYTKNYLILFVIVVTTDFYSDTCDVSHHRRNIRK